MRQASVLNRTSPILALSVGALLLPAAARGQLAAPATQTVLVLPPMPGKGADSAFAIQLGDAIRKRMDGKLRLKLRVVTKEKMSEALGSSGFSPDAILDENGASQLARFVNVDAYITGRVDRNSNPKVRLRLVDNRHSGLSGWLTVQAGAGQTLDDLVNMIVDSVDQQVKAAEQARDCLERRDKQEYGSALDRASRAFRIYPNHPATAMCVSTIYDATKAPPDSQIAILKRAVAGDSLLTRAWEGLARQYQLKADSAAWADAVIHGLAIDPTDMRKRLAAAALLYQIKQYPRAVGLIDEGLDRNPGDATSLQLKSRACFEGQMWHCAVEAMGQRFEADSAVRGDSLYLRQLLAAAQATNDSNGVKNWARLDAKAKTYYQLQPDRAASLKWTGVAVQRFPKSASFWRARASALKDDGKVDDAVAAYQKVAELDPKDVGSRIAAAQLLIDGVKIDSTVPLDTARLRRADEVLQQVAGSTQDDNVKMNIAALYFQPATKMVQGRVRPDLAIELLDKAKANDVKKTLTTQANFFQGLAYAFNLSNAFNTQAIIAAKDCKGVSALAEYVGKLKAAMTAGASVQQSTADQVLKNMAGLDDFIPKAKKAWKCPA